MHTIKLWLHYETPKIVFPVFNNHRESGYVFSLMAHQLELSAFSGFLNSYVLIKTFSGPIK
jgi:hypothetical protein